MIDFAANLVKSPAAWAGMLAAAISICVFGLIACIKFFTRN
jgi:hypothetical protein